MVIILVSFVGKTVFDYTLELFGGWFGVCSRASCSVVGCCSGRELVHQLAHFCFVDVFPCPSCCCLSLLWLMLWWL